jgi:hypothetical protein
MEICIVVTSRKHGGMYLDRFLSLADAKSAVEKLFPGKKCRWSGNTWEEEYHATESIDGRPLVDAHAHIFVVPD